MNREYLFEKKYIPEPMSGCWLWTASIDNWGYGLFGIGNKKTTRAHRWSYSKYVGEIPIGLKVCHRCDNPACVNPNHLFLGTDADNAKDRDKKGRSAKGFKNGKSKLSMEDLILIRESNLSERKIAKILGFSRGTINAVRSGRTWSHI